MNATVKINCTVHAKIRDDEERFRPTVSRIHPFNYVTDLNSYRPVADTAGDDLWSQVVSERSQGAEIGVHVNIWLENITHPSNTGAGVIPLPKGNWDAALSDGDTVSAAVISDLISTLVANLKTGAKY